PELGPRPVIASLSLGVERDFCLRQQAGRLRHSFRLPHGSLLVMAGDTQSEWQHALPRRKKVTRPRVNLTFRCIIQSMF
ncbi:MAG: alpha-ketoglutarate-dependent dioxygenase AlkB, partial [Nannocystaceae bacterium]